MTYSTGVAERDAMLKRALGEILAIHDEPTLANIAAVLPENFELDQFEVEGMLDDVKPEPVVIPQGPPGKPMFTHDPAGHPLPQPTPVVGHPEPATIVIEDGADSARVKTSISEAQARHELDLANSRLGGARERMANLQAELRHRRDDLNAAVRQWIFLAENSTEGLTAEQRVRREQMNFLASNAADRAARRNSTADTAKQAVFARMQNGPSRGAFTRKQAAHAGFKNYDPRRGDVVKVQS